MINYANEPKKSVKNFDNNNTQGAASSMADNAESFIEDTKKNAGNAVYEGAKFLKDESEKELNNIRTFLTQSPLKSAVYALGIGALLSYFLVPRN